MFQRKIQHPRVQEHHDQHNTPTDKDESKDFWNVTKTTILDPLSPKTCRWNRIFLTACLFSAFIDPLFLFTPYATPELCVQPFDKTLDLVLTLLRSLVDVFYFINIFVQFRTAYVAPYSRVVGRGELVFDPWKIASRYLARDFWVDLAAVLPIPQVIIWGVIATEKDSDNSVGKITLRYTLLVQFILRLGLIYPLSTKIWKNTGAMPKHSWAGAAYNVMLYYLFSNVAGAIFYLMGLQRQEKCWRSGCVAENITCNNAFLDCNTLSDPRRIAWLGSTNITDLCDPSNGSYNFGIYQPALQLGATSAPFFRKFFYCFWWGLQNLGAIWDNLNASSNIVENIFTSIFTIIAVVLFALLIGNIQTYIEFGTRQVDEERIKRGDTERWMQHRQLPQNLRRSVADYNEYKWVSTGGVDEEALLRDLPPNLKRKLSRHLWFNLLRQVPLLAQMEEQVLDAICSRLKPSLFTKGAVVLRQHEPISKMLFIIQGTLECYSAATHRGFHVTSVLNSADFCGEELLTWALLAAKHDHVSAAAAVPLPTSTQTVKARSKVDALALMSEDLKYVVLQFQLSRSDVARVFNLTCSSELCQDGAARFIQVAWKTYTRRKLCNYGITKPNM